MELEPGFYFADTAGVRPIDYLDIPKDWHILKARKFVRVYKGLHGNQKIIGEFNAADLALLKSIL